MTLERALFKAIDDEDSEALARALAAGADLNAQRPGDRHGRCALTLCIRNGLDVLARQLIEAGADASVQDSDGDTPLITAAYNRNQSSLLALIAAGANLNARNHNGITALMAAADYGFAGALGPLIAAGADLNALSRGGKSALDIARRNKDPLLADILLAAAEARALRDALPSASKGPSAALRV